MLDKNVVNQAMAQGVAFICAMCENWGHGRDRNQRDRFGDAMCIKSDCTGPTESGCFNSYNGPLQKVKKDYCFLCGEKSTHYISSKLNKNNEKIGLCFKHIEFMKSHVLSDDNEGRLLIIAEELASNENYVVEQ